MGKEMGNMLTSPLCNYFHYDVLFLLGGQLTSRVLPSYSQPHSFPPNNCTQKSYLWASWWSEFSSQANFVRTQQVYHRILSQQYLSLTRSIIYRVKSCSLPGSYNSSGKCMNRPLWYCPKLFPLVHLRHSLKGTNTHFNCCITKYKRTGYYGCSSPSWLQKSNINSLTLAVEIIPHSFWRHFCHCDRDSVSSPGNAIAVPEVYDINSTVRTFPREVLKHLIFR